VTEIEARCMSLSRREQFVSADGKIEWPDGTVASKFRFQHTLYGKVLYGRLAAAQRIELHRHIAEREEAAWGERAKEISAELAHHYTEAGRIERAIHYWRTAGSRALDRSANVEAVAHLHKAMELVATLPPSAERLMERVRMQVTLISPLIAINGYTSSEVEKECRQALELCQSMPDSPELFAVLGGLTTVYINRGQLRVTREIVERMLRIAQQSNSSLLLLWAHYASGCLFIQKGEWLSARDHLTHCLALYDRKLAGSYGFVQDPGPTALVTLAHAVCSLGYPDLALKHTFEALELARQISQPFTLAWVLVYGGELLMRRGDKNAASVLWQESIDLCTRHDFTALIGEATLRYGWALVEEGCIEEGIDRLRRGIEQCEVNNDAAYGRGRLALALGRIGRIEEALCIIEETLARDAEGEEAVRSALLYQVKGELLVMRCSVTEAEACFRQSINIARTQQDRAAELVTTTSLARLLSKQKPDEARRMLAEVCERFTEGFDTEGFKTARALLEQLQT
jgi:tetratricopeptide (TPR) repeat protein